MSLLQNTRGTYLLLLVVICIVLTTCVWQINFAYPYMRNETCRERHGVLSDYRLPITGLLSFPGSGNTWTRHLIQQMTGLGTSSCYCDGSLKQTAFPFECYKDKSRTIVTKAHTPNKVMDFKMQKLVLIIRNPYDAFLSYASYRAQHNHTGVPSKALVIKQFNNDFKRSLRNYIQLIKFTKEQFSGPVFILQYEKLKSDLVNTLRNLATFLNVNVSQGDIDCTVQLQEGHFHRKPEEEQHMAMLRAIYDREKLMKIKEMVKVAEKLIKEEDGSDIDIGGHTEDVLLAGL